MIYTPLTRHFPYVPLSSIHIAVRAEAQMRVLGWTWSISRSIP